MTNRNWNFVVVPLLGVGLFFGTVVGLLWAQDKLDYEGTRGVLLLEWFFAPPDDGERATPPAGPVDDDPTDPPPAAPLGEPAPLATGPDRGVPRGARGGDADAGRGAEPPPVSPLFAGGDAGVLLQVERIEQLLREAERRRDEAESLRRSVDERDAELRIRERDLAERQRRLGQLMAEMDEERKRLDARLAQFEADVRLVRESELDAIFDYARYLVGVDPRTAAEQIEIAWRTPEGQDTVVTAVAQMTPDETRRVLRELPPERVYEIRTRCFDVITEERSR